MECVNADALVIRNADGAQRKIHFSSLRPPRCCTVKRLENCVAPLTFLGFHQHYLINESCQDLTQPELSWEKLSLFEGWILCLELLGKKTVFTLYLLAIRSLCFIIS